jgi:hypothetical protein
MTGTIRYGSSTSWYVDITFTGLDPAKTYTFATSTNRASGTSYESRNSKFTISDVDAATNESTSGVTISTTTFTDDTTVFCTGENTDEGYVARWTGIQPGTDGDFTVSVGPGGTDKYGYGPGVFMLQEEEGAANESPDAPTLVQPEDGAADVATSPTLEITVTDPDDDAIDVTFYGREVGGGTDEDFILIVIPDTQNEAEYCPDVFTDQIQWIVDNETSENIIFVTHVGDIVNTASDTEQWENADAAMGLLDTAGIPYSVSPGNHDIGTGLYTQPISALRASRAPPGTKALTTVITTITTHSSASAAWILL